MVEKKSLSGFWRRCVKVPCSGPLADCIPGPHGVGIGAIHELERARDCAVWGGDLHPLSVDKAKIARPPTVHVKPVAAEDLPEPGILRSPRMIHRHRPL